MRALPLSPTLARMDYPKPDGWQGGSDDFTFVRTLEGHITGPRKGTATEYGDAGVEDADFRRHAVTADNADLGGIQRGQN